MTVPEDSYRLTPQALEEALRRHAPDQEKQKILVLNYPCNPTGHSFSAGQLKELAKVARENNVVILSDEIYALVSFRGQEHHSIAEFYPEGTIVTTGLSKDRSLGGFRVGVMLLPEGEQKLLSALLSLGSETWSCVSAPIQYAALEAYTTDPEMVGYIRDCAAIHELVTKYVHRRVREMGVRCPSPHGAFYLFPDWNEYGNRLRGRGVATSKDLAEELLKRWRVASLPGSAFGMPPDNLCIRIATVDYDGEAALKRFTEDRAGAEGDPEGFVASAAPRVAAACDQLERFTASIH